ncbi:hypothetical protein [Bradyrhizobium sp. 1(2017)]|uniref:hypothetical protein n=1 Tax=Bradyrhizobium sp. 1(2017) TaxID=1404888 RepID=UPI00140EC1DC|nr:hypothetical protein [Bradyrhizobium sp. 1(2017)]QIO32976.1 hypothetical protein HAP40_14765 [Bradyrhizobium sp. 1(2017)]
MKLNIALISLGVAGIIGPAIAQEKAPKTLQEQRRPGVTYEDCVERCNKCGSGKNPDCVKNFCTGYEHRKPGVKPLPVTCMDYGG